MEYISQIINTTIESFDFGFCVAVNILTYLIIKLIDELNGSRKVSTWAKRGVMLIVVIVISIAYCFTGSNPKLIINSAILAPVFWSWVIKPICKYFKIDYKDINILD